MKITNYQQAQEYLEQFISAVEFRNKNHLSFDPLARMRYFLELLGNPHVSYPSVHVGGTAGKGSTAYLVAHILTTAGYKTGLTLSPHLQKMNERMQIGLNQESRIKNQDRGSLTPIGDEALIALINEIIPVIALMKESEHGVPSYFEILLALSFMHFAKEKVEIAVVEVGLGGRFDATNLIHPLVVILTNVGLDHTEILGDTVEKIAKEKVGIIKKFQISNFKFQIDQKITNTIVITGVQQSSVIKIVEDTCHEVGARLYRLGKDFALVKKGDSLVFTGKRTIDNLSLIMKGDYQRDNAALAIEAVLHLRKFGFPVSEEAIRDALKTASFPGRFEEFIIHNSSFIIPVILDGAHNASKMQAFVSALGSEYPDAKKIFIIAFKQDKNAGSLLAEIMPQADSLILTEFHKATDVSKQAGLSVDSILKDIKRLGYYGTKKVVVAENSEEALQKALNISISQYPSLPSLIVVTGSLYLVGEIRDILMRSEETKKA